MNQTCIKDEIEKPECELLKIHRNGQAADILTKGVEPQKWEPAMKILGISFKLFPRKGEEKAEKRQPGGQPTGGPTAGSDTVPTSGQPAGDAEAKPAKSEIAAMTA